MELRRSPVVRTLVMFSVATFLLGTLTGYYFAQNNLAGASLVGEESANKVAEGSIEDIFIKKLLESVHTPGAVDGEPVSILSNPLGIQVASASESCNNVDLTSIPNLPDIVGKALSGYVPKLVENCEKIDLIPVLQIKLYTNTKSPFDTYATVKGEITIRRTFLKMVNGECIEETKTEPPVKFDLKYRLKTHTDETMSVPLNPPVWDQAPPEFKPKGYKEIKNACYNFPTGAKITIGNIDKEKCKDCGPVATPVKDLQTVAPQL